MAQQIWVNARFLDQSLTGVQRYAYEICQRLPQASLVAPCPPSSDYSGLADKNIAVVRTAIGPYELQGHAWDQLVLPRNIPKHSLLWSPGGSGPLLIEKQVVTIHDIAHIEHPEWYSKAFGQWYKALYPLLTRRIRKILTVSEFSRMKIINHFNVAPENVVAIPLGVDSRFTVLPVSTVEQVVSKYGITTPYLLTVAAQSSRKNFQRLYRAWQRIADDLENVSLVIVGEAGLAFSDSAIADMPPKRTLQLGRVPDGDLVALYNGAQAFLYPSLYEGFGLPALEAMACGVPVLTSNLTSLPEVCGEAALLVDPYDESAIAEGITRISSSSDLRNKLREKGLARVQQYTWDRTAELTWKELQEVAHE